MISLNNKILILNIDFIKNGLNKCDQHPRINIWTYTLTAWHSTYQIVYNATYALCCMYCTLSSWSERIGVGNTDIYILLYTSTFDLDTRPIIAVGAVRGVIVHTHGFWRNGFPKIFMIAMRSKYMYKCQFEGADHDYSAYFGQNRCLVWVFCYSKSSFFSTHCAYKTYI